MLQNQTIILNTLADNSADFTVDSSGVLRITGSKFFPKANKCYVQIQTAVAETRGVNTVTFTAPASIAGTTYNLIVEGNSSREGNVSPNTLSYSYTATSEDTVTTVAVIFKNWINNNTVSLQCAATNSSGVLTITANAGYPVITTTTENTAYVAVVNTTAGVPSRGQGTSLKKNPNYYSNLTYGTFTEGAAYTRVTINYSNFQTAAAPSSTSQALNVLDVFINEAATSSGSDNAVINRALILNSSYGSAYLLQAGLRAVAPTTAATTTAAVTASTGAIALASGSVKFFTLGAQSGDYLVINTGTTFSAIDSTKIVGISSATAGVGTTSGTDVTAAAFKYIAVRAIPLAV